MRKLVFVFLLMSGFALGGSHCKGGSDVPKNEIKKEKKKGKPKRNTNPDPAIPSTPANPFGTNEQQFLAAHNEARAKKGIAPLTWSSTLEQFASDWADYLGKEAGCKLIHSGSDKNYGENLAKFWGNSRKSGADAVALWLAEEQHYNYATNSCAEGKVCGHYTQAMWANSKEIGCATYWCTDNKYQYIGVYVCEYSPAGNYRGQKPY